MLGRNLTSGDNGGVSGNGTTASVTPTANALILVTVEIYETTANSTPSVSGNGITYELVGSCADFTNGTGWKKIYLFRGMSASPSTGAIDITSSNDYVAWSVDEITGVKTGANGANAIGQVITGTRDPSGASLDLTFSPALTKSGAFGCIANYFGSTAFTPRTGWMELADRGALDGPQTQWRPDGDSICGWTFTSDEAGGIAIELLPNGPALTSFAMSGVDDLADLATRSTGTLSWNAGDTIYVIGMCENENITLDVPTATGLTFSQVATVGGGFNEARAYLWTATAGSAGSSAINSVQDNAVGDPSSTCLLAWAFNGKIGNYASQDNTASLTISLTRSAPGSVVLYGAVDWNAVGDVAVTADPAGLVRIADDANAGGAATYYGVEFSDQGAPGTTSYGIGSFTGTPQMAGFAVEVKAPASFLAWDYTPNIQHLLHNPR